MHKDESREVDPTEDLTGAVLKILEKGESAEEEEVCGKNNIYDKYKRLRKGMPKGGASAEYERFMTGLRTVFVDGGREVEGGNVAANITALQDYLQGTYVEVKENGLPVGPMEDYLKYAQPGVPSSNIMTWVLENQKMGKMERGSKKKSGGLVGPPLQGGKKKHRKMTRNDDDESDTIDPLEFHSFIKKFSHLDTEVWAELQDIARDTSLTATQCKEKLVDTVIQDADSPWRVFYQQINHYKEVHREYEEAKKTLTELTAEAATLRETNILNQAFLTGDLAQGLVEEIAELKEREQRERYKLGEVQGAVKRAEMECDGLREGVRRMTSHLTEGQNLLKKLQIVAAETASLSETTGIKSAQLMTKIDKLLLAIDPDSGAPSSKRCCACLLVATFSPFCPANGGRHDPSGAFPEPPRIPTPPRTSKKRPTIITAALCIVSSTTPHHLPPIHPTKDTLCALITAICESRSYTPPPNTITPQAASAVKAVISEVIKGGPATNTTLQLPQVDVDPAPPSGKRKGSHRR